MIQLRLILAFSFISACQGFACTPLQTLTTLKVDQYNTPERRCTRLFATNSGENEAKALMERVKKMREEIAQLEGRSLEEVEIEAQKRKEQAEAMNLKLKEPQTTSQETPRTAQQGKDLSVPILPQDQILQAASAIERAFQDGITRQIVRLALIPEDQSLFEYERQWPGGAQQMYREAAGPLARKLLEEIRAPTSPDNVDKTLLKQAPNVTTQIIWDFDGSALITAEAATGAQDDVQALVFSNTDTKYTRDIQTIDKAMGPNRLLMLINPFWRNVESWGFNILAPNGKQMAQEVIFDKFQETYVLLQFSARGEECVALKAYPQDWQLYAFLEDDYWPYEPKIIRLGQTKEEPKSSDFAELLNQREEFKMSRNMRQMQRRIK